MDKTLAENLPEVFGTSEIIRLLTHRGPQDMEQVAPALETLLEAVPQTAGKVCPALMLAADRLADRLRPKFRRKTDPRWPEFHKRLSDLGLTYKGDTLGGEWEYENDLLWKVWNEYGETRWGREAFLLLLEQGWNTGVACGGSSDHFSDVIREGTGFLERHPATPNRLRVIFALAQAYETWWSLSQASDLDYSVRLHEHERGTEAARRKAIGYYEEIRKSFPESLEAAFARRKLPRLKLGFDTLQRRFYCFYD